MTLSSPQCSAPPSASVNTRNSAEAALTPQQPCARRATTALAGERHFGSLIGSRSYCDQLPEEEIDRLANKINGTPLRVALEQAGLSGRDRLRMEPGRYLGSLEAHIEQGARLEQEGLRIGVVTSIVGNWQYRVVCIGEQNHAGTTPMNIRRDAGLGLMRLYMALHEAFSRHAGPSTVWTVGRVEFSPGMPHVIPAKLRCWFNSGTATSKVLNSWIRSCERPAKQRNRVAPASSSSCRFPNPILFCSIRTFSSGLSMPAKIALRKVSYECRAAPIMALKSSLVSCAQVCCLFRL